MTRHDYAKVLLSIRRQTPVSRRGVAIALSIDEAKHTVPGHIANNVAIRQAARRRGFA